MLGGFQELEFDFVADNPGMTLFHCHQQLHMDFGFMALLSTRKVRAPCGLSQIHRLEDDGAPGTHYIIGSSAPGLHYRARGRRQPTPGRRWAAITRYERSVI